MRIALLLATAIAATWAADQPGQPFEIRGVIQEVSADAGGARLRVAGLDIRVPATAAVQSPTAELDIARLTKQSPLPGRAEPGFSGGSATVFGSVVDGALIAAQVLVEPPPAVLMGPVTSHADGKLFVAGRRVIRIVDDRLPARPAANPLGFSIDVASIPPGDEVSAEGYAGSDGVFYAHTLEATAARLLEPEGPRVSVQSAACRHEGVGLDSVEARGGVVLPATGARGVVEVWSVNRTGQLVQLLGEARPERDPELEGLASWQLHAHALTLAGNRCREAVRAVYKAGGRTHEAAGEVNIER